MLGILKNLFTPKNTEALIHAIQSGAYLVDVRTPGEFATGSVKGAVNIPLDSLSSRLSTFKNKNNIIVFCRSGARSGQAKNILEQNAFKNVINGGTWQDVNEVVTTFG